MRTLRFRPRPQGVRSPSECQGSTQPRHCWCSPDTLLSYGDNDAASCRIHTVGQISPASAGQRKPCLCKEKRSKNNEKKNSRPQKDLAAQVGQSDLLAQAFQQIVFSVHGKSVLGALSQHVGSLGGCNMLSQTTHYQCHRVSRSLVARVSSIKPSPLICVPKALGLCHSPPPTVACPPTQDMTVLHYSCSSLSGIYLLLLLCK